ncbi:hypothetical protein [uncultured Tenacibaculum sp.]|uniref:hypothetical protein n=1 Tax=uncultured Tenacibaculum sp. TaxID=174713 RepID=UPI00261FC625|nr:hypothetical protein [uncultured Tenacibaculum sp.]
MLPNHNQNSPKLSNPKNAIFLQHTFVVRKRKEVNSKAINTVLYRSIKKGDKFDKLMPFSDCSSTKIASGNTKVAIDSMALWAKKYQHHTKRLSEKEFSHLSLSKLCKKLHGFLYSHLQYKIDEYDQLLRSPACAWATRAEGLDCKSYSIFASCVLQNCGVSHYLRRVIINQGEGYRHVYVIVPKNQHTYDLKDGYYTIDGTLKTFQEQDIYKADDVFMSVKSVGLSGAIGSSMIQGVGKLVNYAVDEFIAEMNSCSGSVYDASVVELKIRRDLRDKLQIKINDLGDAILFRNRARIQHLFNDIFKEVDLGIAHLRNETAFSSFEHCDGETLTHALAFAEKLKMFLDNFYKEFKNRNPHFKVEEFIKTANVNNRTLYFVVPNDTNPIQADYRFIVLRKEINTYGIEPIFPFEANLHSWLTNNLTHLKQRYTDGREIAYEKEITPLLNKVKSLRSKTDLGGEMLYYFEQPLQRELYRIWLKYDTNYVEFLKEKTHSELTANELALRDYKARFAKTIAEDKSAKKRKALKMQLGIGGLVSALLYVYLKKDRNYE